MKIDVIFNKIKVIACVVAAVMLISSTAWATTYYVSNNGNDSSSGTSTASPWKTISKVNSRSFSPGDKILFERGDTWRETINNSSSGTSGSYIIYGAYGTGAKPIIDLNTTGLDDGFLFDGGEDYIIVENMDILGDRDSINYPACINIRPGATNIIIQDCVLRNCGRYAAIGASFDYGSGVLIHGGSDITISRCKIYGNGIHGVSIWQPGSSAIGNIIVEECEIYDNHHTVGIDIQSDSSATGDINNVIIRYNRIYDTQTADNDPGMYVDGSTSCDITNLQIYGNMFYNIYGWFISFDKNVSPAYIYNNVFYKTALSGSRMIYLTSGADYISVKNNIFMNATSSAMVISDSSHKDIDYNCYYNEAGYSSYINQVNGVTYSNWNTYKTNTGFDTHGLNVNPNMSNPGAYNFTLQSGSPCIDAGTSLGAAYEVGLNPNSSWADNVNLLDQNEHGSGWEIGAYVYLEEDGPDTQGPARPKGVSIIILNDSNG